MNTQSESSEKEENLLPTPATSLHEQNLPVGDAATASSSAVTELPAKISNSLSLNAKEFVPSKIFSFTKDNTAKGNSITTPSMNTQSQPFYPPVANNNSAQQTLQPAQTFPLAMIEVDGVMIDSALVAALRDVKERTALFRLEEALVEFMTECQSRTSNTDESIEYFLDVGGPCFSIILKGNSTSPPTAPIIGGASNNSNTVILRQSTFQRLVMHRLADRFGIIRKASPLSTPTIPLMRLVRVSSSSIPTPLIVELDWSHLAKATGHHHHNNNHNSNSYGSIQVNNNYVPTAAATPVMNAVPPIPQDRTTEVEEENPNESSVSQPSGEEPMDTISRLSNPKVMIMKRSVSSTGTKKQDSDSNLVGMDESGTSGNKLKGKNMGDKEKAYLEARARILGESEVSMDPSDSSIFQALDATAPTPSASGTETPRSQAGDGLSPAPTPTPSESDAINQGNDGGGLASKVLWRNRKQEESDPDFRRGVIPVVVPATTTSSNVYSVPIRGGQMSRMTAVTVPVTSAAPYYPAGTYPNAYSSVPVEVNTTSTTMRFTGNTCTSSQPHLGSAGQNTNRPQRNHETPNDPSSTSSNAPKAVESSLLSEILVQNSPGDDVVDRETNKKDVSPVGKAFAINRRTGSSPWGMTEASNKDNTPSQSSSGSTRDETGKITFYSEEDFPALG